MNQRNKDDVPSPIDFHDPAQARAWMEETLRKRPSRPNFFAAFVRALNENVAAPMDILELGSGPGHLAEHILKYCPVGKYVALDYSNAMHALARERLETFKSKIDFAQIDFRENDWPKQFGKFSAVVTMQAAHETRHKNHLVKFLRDARQTLQQRGYLLYCDHYAQAGSAKNEALFASRDAQPKALLAAGFVGVRRILDEGGMALYEGYKA